MELATIQNNPIEYRGHRVLTLDLIDQLHNRPSGTAARNFNHNRNRFVDGEDYFTIPAAQKNEFRPVGLTIPNRGLIVLTESGYLMLVKSFTDDRAWDVQRALVKYYFRMKKFTAPDGELAKAITGLLKQNQSEMDSLGRDLLIFKETAHQTLESIESTVIDIKSRLPRRPFPAKIKRLYRQVSLSKFGGRCQIHPDIRVVDPAGNITPHGEYDHYFNHSENGQDQGWIISKKANRAMKDRRQRYRPEFEIFQRELRAYLRGQRRSLRIASRKPWVFPEIREQRRLF